MLQECNNSQNEYCRIVPDKTNNEQGVLYRNQVDINRRNIRDNEKQLIAVQKPKEVEIVQEGLEYIQGPVSWYYFETDSELFGISRRFHFFGDIHLSKANGCTDKYKIPCAKVDIRGRVSDMNQRCYDITYLLTSLFKNSKEEKRYTDFMLETYFKIKSVPTPLNYLSQQNNQEKELDYINTLSKIFHQCFLISKEQCPYHPYVRFHYVDIRQSIEQPINVLNMYILLKIQSLSGLISRYTLSVYRGIQQNELVDMKKRVVNSIKFINHLIEKMYGPQDGSDINYNLELFHLILDSDNYVNDLNELLDQLLMGIDTNTENYEELEDLRRTMVKVIATRDGKVQHRVRAQLDELGQENIRIRGTNLADLITEFLLQLYQEVKFTDIYSNWRKFYTIVYPAVLAIKDKNTALNAQTELKNYIISRGSGVHPATTADALLLDGYLLARMFRTFPNPRYGRGQHVPADRVITYTGVAHTETYARFFRDILGLNPVASQVNTINKTRCLQNSNFEEYFKV